MPTRCCPASEMQDGLTILTLKQDLGGRASSTWCESWSGSSAVPPPSVPLVRRMHSFRYRHDLATRPP